MSKMRLCESDLNKMHRYWKLSHELDYCQDPKLGSGHGTDKTALNSPAKIRKQQFYWCHDPQNLVLIN